MRVQDHQENQNMRIQDHQEKITMIINLSKE